MHSPNRDGTAEPGVKQGGQSATCEHELEPCRLRTDVVTCDCPSPGPLSSLFLVAISHVFSAAV